MGPRGLDKPAASCASPPCPEGVVGDEVIDIDALESVAVVSSTKGKGVAKGVRFVEEPIDVDNLAMSARAPSSGSGPSRSSPSQPLLKFGGALGVALYEQKMEVLNDEAEATCAAAPVGAEAAVGGTVTVDGVAPVGEAVSVGRNMSLVKAAAIVREEVFARARAADHEPKTAPDSTTIDREAWRQMPWNEAAPRMVAPVGRLHGYTLAAGPSAPSLNSPAAPSAGASQAALPVSRTMTMPPPQRSRFRSEHSRSVFRPPQRTFVRKAAVMQVARMHADPPTPPLNSASDGEGGADADIDDEEEDGSRVDYNDMEVVVDGVPEALEGLDTPRRQGGSLSGAADEAAPAAASWPDADEPAPSASLAAAS